MSPIPDLLVVMITLTISFFILFYEMFDLYANRRAFNSVRELIFRIIIPFLIGLFYQVPFIIVGYNAYCNLIWIQFVGGAFIALLMWESEAFLGMTLDLDKVGRIWLYIHFYCSPSQKMEVNLYRWADKVVTLESLKDTIESQGIFNKEQTQFETDEDWDRYQDSKQKYEAWKDSAVGYRVEVYSYYDFSDSTGTSARWRGFKKLYFVTKSGILSKKIEGNAVFLGIQEKILNRKFDVLVVWEGFKDRVMGEELEISKSMLSSITYLSEIEEIPLLRAQLKKKDELLSKQRNTIDKIDDDYFLANTKEKRQAEERARMMINIWIRNFIIAVLLLVGVVVAIVILLLLGFFP